MFLVSLVILITLFLYFLNIHTLWFYKKELLWKRNFARDGRQTYWSYTIKHACVISTPQVCWIKWTFTTWRGIHCKKINHDHVVSTPVSNLKPGISWKGNKVKCTVVQALRLCTGRTAHRGSRGIGKGKVHPCTGTEALYRLYGPYREYRYR